jgi:Xaa-Pro aminopeptidase
VEQPDLLLLLAPRARQPVILYLPARNPEQGSLSEAWTGKKLGPGRETEELTGLTALDRSTFESTFADLAGGLSRLYFDYQPSTLDGPVSAAEVLLGRIRQRYPHLEIVPLSRLVDSLRVVKDSVETGLIQRAVDITGEALKETIPRIRPGLYEYEVQASIEYGFKRRGSQRPSFPTIVGSGPNSTVLHYERNRRQIGKGELVLMDVGAELDYYAADITRTVPADGRFSPRQREIYSIVLAASRAGIAAARPGATLRDVHQAARDVIEKAGFGKYFVHYTSHFLGMDVHDVGSRDMPLAPGMVFTVEPGIYLPEENLGVRIEDDVLVTKDGCRVLSESIPRKIEEIEKLMQSH